MNKEEKITQPKTKTEEVIEHKVLPILKASGHIVILLLILALFVTIAYELYLIFFVEIATGNFTGLVKNLLFTLILIELLTILYSYLKKGYIKVERVIELGIISLVREMLFKVEEFDSGKIYAIAALLISFGAIFFIEKYWSKTRNK